MVTPQFMISSPRAIIERGQLVRDLDKDDTLIFLTDVQTTSDARKFQVTKVTSKKFIDDLNSHLCDKNNSSVLFFVPDDGTELDEVISQCEKLQRSVRSTVIPCIYTHHDRTFFSLMKGANQSHHGKYSRRTTRSLGSKITKIADGINFPLNILAVGYGAQVLSRLKDLKLTSKEPIFSNLFLAAPALAADFFANKEQSGDSERGIQATNFFRRVHVFYDKDDKVLRRYSEGLEIENGIEVGLMGSTRPPDEIFGRLNCNRFAFWEDPYRHHIYFQCKKCLDYIDINLATYNLKDVNHHDNFASNFYAAQ